MKKTISSLLELGKSKKNIGLILLGLIALTAVAVCLPLSLVLGLQLIGFPVKLSLQSWFGGVLVIIFIKAVSANNKETKEI
jgi:uncharacterized membrane protein YbhN (UPF0104 family)